MTKHWSSSQVRPSDRLAIWMDIVCDMLLRAHCEPRRDQKFFGEISHDNVGAIGLVTMQANARGARRTASQAADDPADSYHVHFIRRGHALVEQDGREAALRPGDFALSYGARPFSLTFDGDFSTAVVEIPRQMLLQRVGAAAPFTVLRIDGANGLGAMVSSMLRELPARLATIPDAMRTRVGENIVDLVTAALLSAASDGAPLSAHLTLARVKFWIETHLSEKLSGEEIARQCNLSVRHLNRLFAAEGTSLMHYVWERRLMRCHRDLADPALAHRSINDIAFAAGFNDQSHFSRAYRIRFGVPPRQARDNA